MVQRSSKKTKRSTKKDISSGRKILILLGVLVAIAAFAMGVHYLDKRFDVVTPALEDKMGLTIYGEIDCLPKKGDGPHTLECALGLKDDEGNYYALIDARPKNMPDTGTRVKIDGVFLKVNEEKTQYDVVGSIRYARVKVIE